MIKPAMQQSIIAHAGCLGLSGLTTGYILAAVAAGAHGVEIDLTATGDGQGVLAHDPVITDADGRPLDLHSTALKEARLRQPDLTTLDDVLAIVRQHRLLVNIDIKDLSVIPAAAAAIRSWRCQDQAYLTGIGLSDVATVVEAWPDVQVFVNLRQNGRWMDWMPGLARRAADETREAKRIGVAGINIEWILCSEAWVRLIHDLGLPVSCWTIDRTRIMQRVAGWGADLLTTNQPACMLRQISRGMSSGQSTGRDQESGSGHDTCT